MCVPSNSSIFLLKTRCKPLSHTYVLLILQVCFLSLSLAPALCLRIYYMLKGILCVYYHSNELGSKSEREHQSNPIPIQRRFNQAFQTEMNISNEFYFIVLFCDLDTALANWLLYHTLSHKLKQINSSCKFRSAFTVLYLLHWNSRPLIE